MPFASGPTSMNTQYLMDSITPIIFILWDSVATDTMPILLHMLPYDTSHSLPYLYTILQKLKSLTSDPINIGLLDIKSDNVLFCQLHIMFKLEPVLTYQILEAIMEDLRQYLQDDTSTLFISKYQDFRDAYILQALQATKSRH